MQHQSVQLRQLGQEDIPVMARLANNIKIFNNVRDAFGHPYTEENAQRFFDHQLQSDTEVVFAIEAYGQLCGLCGLILQPDIYRKSAEIGYWLGEPFWGQGIATKAINQLVHHAFQERKLMRMYAGVFEYNIGSMRVLEKNGFEKEGIAKKQVFKNGKFWDEHRYGLISHIHSF